MITRESLELSDIIERFADNYSSDRNLPSKHQRVLSAIRYCRTERLGCHLDQCTECNHREISYNSCRDRHCPKCQGTAQRQWVEKRTRQLLPVPYYHVVFTLPAGLFPFSLYNKELIYNLLFASAAATLKQFGEDPKWLGGQLGFFGILHTWGQTLWHHPHVHFIVAGGARGKSGGWIPPKHQGKFLFPVRAVSEVFQGTFMRGLEKAFKHQEIVVPDEVMLANPNWQPQTFLRSLVRKEWVVYCKSPFKKAEQVVRYIGRYTHRVAISNSRLMSMDMKSVKFLYRDYKDNRKTKSMRLKAQEFLQRFLWHVLPENFHRIRHYGFLANGVAERSCKEITAELGEVQRSTTKPEVEDSFICKKCGAGRMVILQLLTASGHLIIPDKNHLLDST